MRWPNDTRLAEQVPDIDLILGGHDHDFITRRIDGKLVIKSGTDFRTFAVVTLKFRANGSVDCDFAEKQVTSDIAEDPEIKEIVDDYLKV